MTSVLIFFLWNVFVRFGIMVMLASLSPLWGVSSSSVSEDWYILSLKCLTEFTSETIGPNFVFEWTTNSISLVDRGLVKFTIPSCVCLSKLHCSENVSIYLSCWIYWHKVARDTCSFNTIFTHLFLILVISLIFFLVSLSRACQLCYPFKKDIHIIFSTVYLFSISLISLLFYFLLLTLDLLCPSFSRSYCKTLGHWFIYLSLSLSRPLKATHFPLSTALAISHKFWYALFSL